MTRVLAVEVEFLTGVSVAARPNRREEAEWPPHPDRLFQALVAAWGRNEPPDPEEQAALEWLEGLDADGLMVSAPPAHRRDVVDVYVPPNDARTTEKSGTAALRVVPEFRKNRQRRVFPAVLPSASPPVVRYVWLKAPGLDSHRAALARLLREVTYLGHSHSLVRASLIEDSGRGETDAAWIGEGHTSLRLPYTGRLKEIRERYDRSLESSRIFRPNPSLVMRTFKRPSESIPPGTCFDGELATVFADAGGFCPSLVAFPLVAKRLRDALLKTAGKGRPIPTLLSGHDPDGRPTDSPHIAIVPLADVGWTHSQGRLMGLALVWPREVAEEDRRATLMVLAAFLRQSPSKVGLLHFGRDGSWSLSLEPESERASLRFERFARAARRWATVLPAVLDRHPKDKPGEDLPAIVARACINAGLPSEAVDGLDMEVHKHASIKGAPSVRELEKSLPEDSPYRGRPLRHLVLTFPKPIRGPLILGAGRFRGLGLCLPLSGAG